ncbi:S-adenosyl-L-methionine-dependent methyltransferase [Cystobasidium minutum MCA 4210]|uniref:S-adenosyl-L-methionine-dependent methyltransferase n=1 Tax=Cystobasidium minutum MCA 4210 TaxID=1397322 RepID=UPI0034CDC554|eukprot:jgi/Rhomi1/199081/gm1.7295_g
MTTFAKRTFDAAGYLRFRPTYSSTLIEHVLQFANPPAGGAALDLGCGPGQATAMLGASGRFHTVVGMDPSQGMIEAAQSALGENVSALLGGNPDEAQLASVKRCKIKYVQGSAENLDAFEPESFDLVTAGQAAHWFNHEAAYNQIARILKPGGTVAYWGYAYMFLPDAPAASKCILDLGQKKLGSYWESGREGPESLYDLVPFPKGDAWDISSFRRYKFDQTASDALTQSKADLAAPPETHHLPVAMGRSMTREDLMKSLKTWSSVHNYMEKNPDSENVIDVFNREIDDLLPKQEPFAIQWPVGMLLMRKKT